MCFFFLSQHSLILKQVSHGSLLKSHPYYSTSLALESLVVYEYIDTTTHTLPFFHLPQHIPSASISASCLEQVALVESSMLSMYISIESGINIVYLRSAMSLIIEHRAAHNDC